LLKFELSFFKKTIVHVNVLIFWLGG
jgi:hypothetical protein